LGIPVLKYSDKINQDVYNNAILINEANGMKLSKTQLTKIIELANSIPADLESLKANIGNMTKLADEIEMSPKLVIVIIKGILNPSGCKFQLVAHSSNGNTYELKEQFKSLGFSSGNDLAGFYWTAKLADVDVSELPEFAYELR
jgi:hypothetical protein